MYRAFHAIRDLRRRDGLMTNAVYGFLQMLKAILEEYAPEKLVVVFDPPGETFRSALYDQYKIQREPSPEALAHQWEYIFRAVDALGIKRLSVAGYEADDVLGTLARHAEAAGMNVVVLSGDKDLLQLVSERVTVISRHGDNVKVYDPAGVHARYGVSPSQVVDVLALMGDSSDNIPGVPGIGEKGACKLIAQYGSLENVLARADEIAPKRARDGLLQHADQARLSKELAAIRTDVPVDCPPAAWKRGEIDAAALAELFAELEFAQLAKEFNVQPKAPPLLTGRYIAVETMEQLASLLPALQTAARLAVDTETTGVNPLRCALVGISLAWNEGEAVYLPLRHVAGPNLPLAEVQAALNPILSGPALKIGHNIKYDVETLTMAGFVFRGPVSDTMVAQYLLGGGESGKRMESLDALALSKLHVALTPIDELIGVGSFVSTMDEVDVPRVAAYAGQDADAALRLEVLLRAQLEDEEQLRLFDEVEMPLLLVLAEMEQVGVRVDPVALREQSKEMGACIERLEQAIYRAANTTFNLNSPKQLGEVLFDRMGAKVGFKRSTSAEVLEKLAGEGNEVAALVLEYRKLSKLKSTYLDALQALIDPRDGRVHTSYNQSVANTGRLSSSDPNLQNIPVRTDEGRRVREAFVAEPGWRLISSDYSQIELRVLAHLTNDPSFVKAFAEDADIHARTAAEVFGVDEAAVGKELRARAKAINFGLIYGMTEHGLAARLGIGRAEAAEYIERYFARYPTVRRYQEETVAFARAHGYVRTELGRRVRTPRIHSANRMEREAAERAAINGPVQGMAADLLKLGMIRLRERLAGMRSRMILTVHDEVVVEAPEHEVERVLFLVKDAMESAAALRVPLRVDTHVGRTWAELG